MVGVVVYLALGMELIHIKSLLSETSVKLVSSYNQQYQQDCEYGKGACEQYAVRVIQMKELFD